MSTCRVESDGMIVISKFGIFVGDRFEGDARDFVEEHAKRRLANERCHRTAPHANGAKRFQIWIRVERNSISTDAAMNRDADRGENARANRHDGVFGIDLRRHIVSTSDGLGDAE